MVRVLGVAPADAADVPSAADSRQPGTGGAAGHNGASATGARGEAATEDTTGGASRGDERTSALRLPNGVLVDVLA